MPVGRVPGGDLEVVHADRLLVGAGDAVRDAGGDVGGGLDLGAHHVAVRGRRLGRAVSCGPGRIKTLSLPQ